MKITALQGLTMAGATGGSRFVPYAEHGLHFSKHTIGKDWLGVLDRTSVMSKKWTGHVSGTYIRFADFVSTALTYYDLVLGAEVATATDVNGDFVLPLNAISYIDIAGYRWIPEEIRDAQDNGQTTFYDTTGTYQAQAFLTWYTDEQNAWVANSVQGEAYSNRYGVTVAGALGKNLLNKYHYLTSYRWQNGVLTANASYNAIATKIAVVPNSTYIASRNGSAITEGGGVAVDRFDADGNFLRSTFANNGVATIASDEYFVGIWGITTAITDPDTLQLELGSTATAYEAWEGYYKDSAHTIPYADGQPLHALDNGDGTFSRQFCKAWLDTGAQAPLDSVGRIKHQVDYGVALNNEVTNGDFSDGTTGHNPGSGATLSVVGGKLLVTGNGANAIVQVTHDTGMVASGTPKVFVYVREKVDNSVTSSIQLYAHDSTGTGTFTLVAEVLSPSQDTDYELYGIINLPGNFTNDLVLKGRHNYPDAATANGKIMEVDGTAGVFAINMTALGIESFTEAQMLALVQDGYFDDYKFFPESTNSGPNSFRLQQDYPLVQSADLTDTLVDDHTLDEPTNAVVAVADLVVNIGDQIFTAKNGDELTRLLMYERAMTTGEKVKIDLFMGR